MILKKATSRVIRIGTRVSGEQNEKPLLRFLIDVVVRLNRTTESL
jgi:hypothetical protein